MERADPTLTAAPIAPVAPSERGEAVDEVDLIPVRTYWQLVRQRFAQHRLAVMALIVLAVLVVLALAVPTLTGNTYKLTRLDRVDAMATVEAPLGYNEIGQNIAVRLAKATQTSLLIGLAAVLIIVGIGILVGSIAGYMGGWTDNLLMRFVDIVLSLPGLFIILMIVSLFGVGDVRVVIIAIGITGWTLAARLIRAEFLALRNADYVQAARALGAGHRRIIVRHMLPAAMAPLVVAAALGVADSVVTEAALSFLGFGISPPEASLGNMLTNAQSYFFSAPERALYPGVVLVLLVLCASFLGDGLRDALDPRQRIEA
ncbi:MAG TPA: ABC transporter permease [Candidatus Limnocylindrales bacterium]|nr:ABC transporter permease [Candidatus Limnocylindrales bacterium]